MGEIAAVVAAGWSGGPAGLTANVAGKGSEDPGSRSVVMRVEDNLVFLEVEVPG